MYRPMLRSLILAASLAVNLLVALALVTGLAGQAAISGAEAARELPAVGAKVFARVDFSGDDLIDKARSRNVRRLEYVRPASTACIWTRRSRTSSLPPCPARGTAPSSFRSGSSDPTGTSAARTVPTSS